MIGGEPKIGYVFRYAYLWHSEFDRAQQEGAKERPCVLIVATTRLDPEGRLSVRVVRITHRAPADQAAAVEIPLATKRRLGLDGDRSWVILAEGNSFVWPGPDIRAVPGKLPKSIYYGPLPPKLFRQIIRQLVAMARLQRHRDVPRTN
jgi:hypothetical protein